MLMKFCGKKLVKKENLPRLKDKLDANILLPNKNVCIFQAHVYVRAPVDVGCLIKAR